MCLFVATVLYTDPLEGNSRLLFSGCSGLKHGMLQCFSYVTCSRKQTITIDSFSAIGIGLSGNRLRQARRGLRR